MMPHCQRESQFEMFEAAAPPSGRAPKLALPFQQSEAIDVTRVCRILDTNKNTVIRLLREGYLSGYQVHRSKYWRIEYSSVVDYCNRLRVEYRIGTRAVVPAGGFRVKDKALLPFPPAETLTIEDVREVLDCGRKAVLYMIDEGVLTAYQLKLGAPESPWRIYRRSLERYMESLWAQARAQPVTPSRHGSPMDL
jgi:hypothetical protein